MTAGTADQTFVARLGLVTRYGLARVAPAVAGIVIVPLVLAALGPETYGRYSIYLGLALLIASLASALITQPMYRFLASDGGLEAMYRAGAWMLAGLAGLVTGAVILMTADRLDAAVAFGLLATASVACAHLSVSLQIAGRPGRLALMETVRAILLIAFLALQADRLSLVGAALAQAGAAALALVLFNRGYALRAPGAAMTGMLAYGAKSALWLVLAGSPLTIVKAVLLRVGPAAEAGALAALLDLAYRACALVNSAVTMAIFPALSRAYDQGRFGELRRSLAFGICVYFGCAVALLAAGWGLLRLSGEGGAGLTGIGPATTLLAAAACLALQAMSVSHKPYELRLQTGWMTAKLALCLLPLGVAVLAVFAGHGPAAPLLLASIFVPTAYYCVSGAMLGWRR